MRATLATCALLLAAATQLHAAPLPTTGMTMNAVEHALGAPREKTGPVGRPPITRWVYDGVVVVFEHNKVVQSVQITGEASTPRPTPAPATPATPKTPVPVPAIQAPKPAPAPAAPSDAQIRNNEAIRRAAEQEADEKARAATEAARKAAEAAEAAQAKAKAAATIEAEKAVETTPAASSPASTPATAPTTPPATPTTNGTDAKDPSYSFDPATGRIIIN